MENIGQLLSTEINLVDLHNNLNDFASYHQDKGGQKAHQLIRQEICEKRKDMPMAAEDEKYHDGYNAAIRDVLKLIHSNFVK